MMMMDRDGKIARVMFLKRQNEMRSFAPMQGVWPLLGARYFIYGNRRKSRIYSLSGAW